MEKYTEGGWQDIQMPDLALVCLFWVLKMGLPQAGAEMLVDTSPCLNIL